MGERFFTFLLFAFTFNLIVTEAQQRQNVADLEQGSGYTFSGDGGTDEDDDNTKSTRAEGSGGHDSESIESSHSASAAAIPDFVPEGHITDDITIEEPSTLRPMDSERASTRKTSKLQSSTIGPSDMHYDSSDVSVNTQKPAFFSFLFRDPLIFAGIVGGAVLALLCIILLVMFTIYRMRKKDEGSYALDEPKKSYGFAYTRARDKEFFA